MARRLLPLGGVLALVVLAWAYLLREAAGMASMADMASMAGTGTAWSAAELAYLCVMWSIMMAAMMLPSAAPTILVVSRVGRGRRDRAAGAGPGWDTLTPSFVAGYLVVWTGYSVAAASSQWVLHGMLLVSDGMVSASTTLSGSLLIGAGLFQLTSLKDRCVSHCRSPLSFVMGHWRDGTLGAFRMGLHHGAYCVGCCWALMALLFVLGVMNLLWVLALAVLVLAEKTLPGGAWVTRAGGVALIVWGALVLAAPLLG